MIPGNKWLRWEEGDRPIKVRGSAWNSQVEPGANVKMREPFNEVLPDAYLRAAGVKSTTSRFSANPSIALGPEIHGEINRLQLEGGIRDPAFLLTLTPKQVVKANDEFLLKAGLPEQQALEVSNNTLKYAYELGIRCP